MGGRVDGVKYPDQRLVCDVDDAQDGVLACQQ